MSGLLGHLDGYLSVRRALGFGLARDEKLLRQFCGWLAAREKESFTAADAVAWAQMPQGAPSWHAWRLSVARGFARYLVGLGWHADLVPAGLLRGGASRAVPFIYPDAEIEALMEACGAVFRDELRRLSMRALIGLLAVTGARVGEAIALDAADSDAVAGTVSLRTSKSGGGRKLPLHPTSTAALEDYLADTSAIIGRGRRPDEPVFLSAAATRPIYRNVQNGFHKLTLACGIAPREGAKPRLHDLRHAMATKTMVREYQAGEDPGHALAVLSAWLGHAAPAHTYWYVDQSQESLAEAVAELENPSPRHASALLPERGRMRP
jgi:integrase